VVGARLRTGARDNYRIEHLLSGSCPHKFI
jgi:hypothetical protein